MNNGFPTGRLGRQIALVFVLFATLVTLGLGLSLVGALHAAERNMLDDTLFAELAHYRNTVETAQTLGAFHSRTTIIYVTPFDSVDEIPEHARYLPVGTHEITVAAKDYRVLIEELDGIRYTVQFDDTSIHQRERYFVRLVWLTSLIIIALSVALGWWLSRRLARPMDQLAHDIRELSIRPSAKLDVTQYQNDEVGLVANRLKTYHEQLTDVITREKEFAGNVSHELRTPVTTISLAAEMLAEKSDLSPKDREKLQRIERATREMSELLDTFLVLAIMDDETDTVHSACDVAPIVADVVAQQRVWLGDKSVDVHIENNAPLAVSAPPRVLSVLIANLVRNAFRYTSEGSVTVHVNKGSVVVEDTGVGIDAETQPHVFKRHVRGKTGDRDGAGLGLSIVQRICERYRWTVNVDSTQSEEHHGSRFTVRFDVE